MRDGKEHSGAADATNARRVHSMPFGAEYKEGVRFQLWAPKSPAVKLELQSGPEPIEMTKREGGWFEARLPDVEPGTRYQFVLPDGRRVADPASRWQPDGPDGVSEVVDPKSYVWRNPNWRSRPWHEAVLYEMHIGAFTSKGDFRSAIGKLDHLVELGITAIELMPVADFPGDFSWGYDGVLPFAPAHVYGQPDDLKAFVDACHDRSIMVLLDVVYNHFGPDGNFLGLYAPITTSRHKTPWGDALNFDDAHSGVVRDLFVHNALFWLEEYCMDGLRLDSINFIKDSSEKHVLEELAERVRAECAGRDVHIIVENSLNHADWLKRAPSGEPIYFTAQWSEDIHHTLHCMATGELHGYLSDFGRDPVKMARAQAEGFCYQGEVVPSLKRPNGEPSAYLPPTAFVSYLQNHDQIGNRPFGERMAALTSRETLAAITAIHLLSPHIPLLFMGEEWGSKRPFQYFADVRDELAQSIRDGRKQEFHAWYSSADERPLPDPVSPSTFIESKLDWSEPETREYGEWLALYIRLLKIRKSEISPRNAETAGDSGSYEVLPSGVVVVRWRLGDGSVLSMVANLEADTRPGVAIEDRQIWNTGVGASLDCALGRTRGRDRTLASPVGRQRLLVHGNRLCKFGARADDECAVPAIRGRVKGGA